VNTVFNSVSDWRITQGFEEECIICDMPGPLPYQKLDLAPTGSPVYQLAYMPLIIFLTSHILLALK